MKPSDLFEDHFIETIEKKLLNGEKLEQRDADIEYVSANQFLTYRRIDLAIRLYYIECREKNKGYEFAKIVYSELIKSITHGNYSEEWNSSKQGIEDYITSFDNLIDDVKNNGFDPKKSVIPVGSDNGILDGSHRVAIAIYFKLKLPIYRLECKSWDNRAVDFLNNGSNSLPEKYTDFMVYQYLRYKPDVFIAVLWPVSYNHLNYQRAIRLVEEYSNVVYKKTVKFNYNGLTQLCMHTYLDADWTGGFENNLDGIHLVAAERYAKNAPATFLFIEDISLEETKSLKNTIRIILDNGFCKIHITDTQAEAIRLGQMVLNENSVHFLNDSFIFRYSEYIDQFLIFREEVIKQGLFEDTCVDTGGVLGIYGLRSTNDIDFLSQNDVKLASFDSHNQDYYNQIAPKIKLDNIIYNWFNHFYCFDIKFSSIDSVKDFKLIRAEAKDKKDVELISEMKTECPYEKDYIKNTKGKKKGAFKKKIKNAKRHIKKRLSK